MLGRITVLLLFLLLLWGNLVAGLKAGLACPDWPLCHGRAVPPFRWDIYMEYLHRVIAAVTAGALLSLAWKRFRSYRGASRAVPLLAAGILAGEIALGGAVVLLELPVRLTTLHFMAGMLLFVLAFYMTAFDGNSALPRFGGRGRAMLFLGLGILVFLQAGLGAYVRHSGSGLACPDFPYCGGSLLPPLDSGPVLVHFSHRLLAVLIFLTAGALYIFSIQERGMERSRALVLSFLLLMLGQIGIGGLVVLSRLNFVSAALHLAMALAMIAVLFHLWVREIRVREAGCR